MGQAGLRCGLLQGEIFWFFFYIENILFGLVQMILSSLVSDFKYKKSENSQGYKIHFIPPPTQNFSNLILAKTKTELSLQMNWKHQFHVKSKSASPMRMYVKSKYYPLRCYCLSAIASSSHTLCHWRKYFPQVQIIVSFHLFYSILFY